MVQDASKYRANRIVFESDSDDDEAVDDLTHTVNPVQPDKQVYATSTLRIYELVIKTRSCRVILENKVHM